MSLSKERFVRKKGKLPKPVKAKKPKVRKPECLESREPLAIITQSELLSRPPYGNAKFRGCKPAP